MLEDVALAAWEEGWRGSDGPAGVLGPAVLQDDAVVVLGARADDRVVAGAVLNVGASVVGVSNVFTDGDPSSAWASCVAAAAEIFPEAVLVGYESGETLDAARRVGFTEVGRLRVWRRDGPRPG